MDNCITCIVLPDVGYLSLELSIIDIKHRDITVCTFVPKHPMIRKLH